VVERGAGGVMMGFPAEAASENEKGPLELAGPRIDRNLSTRLERVYRIFNLACVQARSNRPRDLGHPERGRSRGSYIPRNATAGARGHR
jgi:hypothetical protein